MSSDADTDLDLDPDDASHPAAGAMFALPPDAGRTGQIMQTIAVAGVVVTLIASVVVWVFVGDLQRNVDRSLTIGEEAATTLVETIDVADRLLVTLDDGLDTIGASLVAIDSTITDVAELSDATSQLAATLPETFDDIDAALGTVESLGGVVDTTLGALSRVPFGPDYDPDVSFPEAIAGLRTALDPIGDELGAISTELSDFSSGSGGLQAQIATLSADLAESRAALGGTAALLDAYRATAEDARELAVQGRSDLDSSMTWTRVVIVLVTLLVLASQYVPWWLGSRLVEARRRPTLSVP
jgi:hypothetical protein